MLRKSFALAAAILMISAVTALACGDNAQKTGSSAMINSEKPQQVTLKGQLVCSTCSLKAQGAHSACSEFGCTQALKTADGRIINLMRNKFSSHLISDKALHNKPVEIAGMFFANANTLDVQSYSVDGGKKMSWCDHCKTMDACMATRSY